MNITIPNHTIPEPAQPHELDAWQAAHADQLADIVHLELVTPGPRRWTWTATTDRGRTRKITTGPWPVEIQPL